MEKILFDTHCHISDSLYDDCREALIEEIRASRLKYAVDIGTRVETSLNVCSSIKNLDFCYGTVGMYPGNCYGRPDSELDILERLYKENEKIVAIGEIGLDNHYDDTDKEQQNKWFANQIELAKSLDAPICIHSREADDDTLRMLKDHKAFSNIKVLMHCFAGSAELARQYVKLGAVISICGPVTYKNARKTVEVVEQIGLEHLVVETDAPYLTPVPFRGKRNKPNYVEYTALKIAEIKGISFEEVAETTLKNACEFYGIPL
jgi:TatD DNase family protein